MDLSFNFSFLGLEFPPKVEREERREIETSPAQRIPPLRLSLSTHNDNVNNRSENVYFSPRKNKVVKLTDSFRVERARDAPSSRVDLSAH